MFSRDCATKKKVRDARGAQMKPTLSSETRSAAWRRVKPEMSSTIRPILGSIGGGVEDGDASAAVASHLDRVVREASLGVDGT